MIYCSLRFGGRAGSIELIGGFQVESGCCSSALGQADFFHDIRQSGQHHQLDTAIACPAIFVSLEAIGLLASLPIASRRSEGIPFAASSRTTLVARMQTVPNSRQTWNC